MDHDRTVLEARNNMAEFDRQRALERWLQNYVHPALGVPAAYWCACVKIEKRWRIEFGFLTGTQAVAWCNADPGAPEPPILEFRRPKPEPVKPRHQWRDPVDWMPSHTPLLDGYLAELNSKIMTTFMVPDEALANTAAQVSDGLTYAKMRAMLDNLPPGWRGPVRSPIYEPVLIGIDYGKEPSYAAAMRYLSLMPPPKIPESTLRYLRDLDIPEPPKPPPPLPSKRNQ